MQSTHVRDHNLSLCLRILASAGESLPRSELALRTSLTRPTVSKLVEELMRGGLVAEEPPRIHGSGRPVVPLHLAEGTLIAIGLDVTADRIACRAEDMTGSVIAQADEPFPAPSSQWTDAIELCGRLVGRVRRQAGPLPVVGVCVAVPGRIDPSGDSVLSAPGLGWSDVPLVSRLREHPEVAGVPTSARNDNRLSVLTELERRPGRSFLYLRGHTGVGGAIVLGGRVLEGDHGWAGEFGHVVVQPDGALCRCGRRGCLEAYASADALRARAGLGGNASMAETVQTLGRTESRQEVVQGIARAIGIAVAGAMNTLDLSTVVLSGHLAPIADELGPVLRATVQQHALALEAGPIAIEGSAAPADLALKGAARQALEPVFTSPSAWIARSDGAATCSEQATGPSRASSRRP